MRMYRWLLPPALAAGLASCAYRQPRLSPLGTPCVAATSELNEHWRKLADAGASPGGCAQDDGIVCAGLRSKIERLSVDCPRNPDVIMANALLTFEDHNFVRTQELLDDLFGLGYGFPEAVVLRARVAMAQGNTRFALRFLEEKIREMGADFTIRETYASALFVGNRWREAQVQLNIAEKLGAPLWRVAYGTGLIEEASGNFEAAKARYQEALHSRPGWQLAESRLKALRASGKIPD